MKINFEILASEAQSVAVSIVPVQIHFMVELQSFAEVFMLTVQRSCLCCTCTMFEPLIFPEGTQRPTSGDDIYDHHLQYSIKALKMYHLFISIIWNEYQNLADLGVSKSGQLLSMSGSRSCTRVHTHARTHTQTGKISIPPFLYLFVPKLCELHQIKKDALNLTSMNLTTQPRHISVRWALYLPL